MIGELELGLAGLRHREQLRETIGGLSACGELAAGFREFRLGGDELGFLDEASQRSFALSIDAPVGQHLKPGSENGYRPERTKWQALVEDDDGCDHAAGEADVPDNHCEEGHQLSAIPGGGAGSTAAAGGGAGCTTVCFISVVEVGIFVLLSQMTPNT